MGSSTSPFGGLVNFLAIDARALALGNDRLIYAQTNAIEHSHVSANIAYESRWAAEKFGDLKELPSDADIVARRDSWHDQWNNEVGRRIGEWAADNGYGRDAIDRAILDALDSGELIINPEIDPRVKVYKDFLPDKTPVISEYVVEPTWKAPNHWDPSEWGTPSDTLKPRDYSGGNYIPDLARRLRDAIVEYYEVVEQSIERLGDRLGELVADISEFLRDFLSDPLVLDLDGSGIDLIPLSSSATRFDLTEDGTAERTGWVAAGDGFLVHDKNGNNSVDGIGELLGSALIDGFEALRPLDANGDGLIDARDPAFAALKVWRDSDRSGSSEAIEMLSLGEVGISSFSLASTQVDRDIDGNTLARVGTYTRIDGASRTMGSVWFALDQTEASPPIPEGVDLSAIRVLPNFSGYGGVPDLHTAMALDPTLRQMVEGAIADLPDFDTFHEFTQEAFEPILLRWLGLDALPVAGDDTPLHIRAIEELTGQTIPVDDLNGFQQARMGEVFQKWTNTVDALAVRFFIQINGAPLRQAYADAIDELTGLNDQAVDYVARVSAIVSGIEAAKTVASPLEGIGLPFAMLKIDGSGNVVGDFNAFAAKVLATQPSFAALASSGGGAGSAQSGGMVVDEAGEHPWNAWFWNHGSLLFDVASAMGIGSDYVLNVTGWRWLSGGVTSHIGTSASDIFDLTATYYYVPSPHIGDPPVRVETRDQLLFGLAGDDELRGNDGVDRLVGGRGNDVLKGGTGSDMYVYATGDGVDRIVDQDGSEDALFFSSEFDAADLRVTRAAGTDDLVLTFGNFGDEGIVLVGQWASSFNAIEQFYFVAEDGLNADDVASRYIASLTTGASDVIEGSWANETLRGGNGNDVLSGNAGKDEIYGDAGDDTLVGGVEDDQLQGGAGDDHLLGEHGDDVLEGGAGDDTMSGDGGDDVYFFERGHGQDIVREYSRLGWWGGDDVIRFGRGIMPTDVIVTQTGDGRDLVLRLSGSTDTIVIERTMTSGDDRVERVMFADATIWTHADLVQRSMSANAGNDLFYGSFNGEVLDAGSGDDVLRARGGDDVLLGGTGNDTLSGDGGDDIYLFRRGDGHDTIVEYSEAGGWGGFDTVQFASGIAPSDVRVSQVNGGADVLLTIIGGGSITIRGTTGSADHRVDQVTFADGTVWKQSDLIARMATDGSDSISAGYDSDFIRGGLGDDSLSGGGGDDTYFFARGDGKDVITDVGPGGWGGSDTVQFAAGIAPADVSVSQQNGGADIVLSIVGGDRITMRGTIGSGDHRIERILFADGTVWLQADLIARMATDGNDTISAGYDRDVLRGGFGADILSGGGGDDTYLFDLGDGADAIRDGGAGGWGGADTVRFGTGINPANVVVSKSADGQDIVIDVGGGDMVTLRNTIGSGDDRIEQVSFADGTVWTHADLLRLSAPAQGSGGAGAIGGSASSDTIYGTDSADLIRGLAGNDLLEGRSGNDTLDGGAGDDTLAGGGGDDVYRWARGDGRDVVNEDYWSGTSDRLLLEGVAASAVSLVRDGNSVTVLVADSATGANDGGSVRLNDSLADDRERGVETIQFGDGSTWGRSDLRARLIEQAATSGNDDVRGFNGNDVLRGGAGDDTLAGGGGDDVYRWARGDGRDVVNEDYWSGTGDRLVLEGIAKDAISLVRDGNSVTVLIADSTTGSNDGGSIRLNQSLADEYERGVEMIQFGDGSIWSRGELRTQLIEQSATSGNDDVKGFAGNDVLRGGTGDDTLAGGGGDDVYRWARGDGNDIIDEAYWSGSNDRLILDGVLKSEVIVRRHGSSLQIVIPGSAANSGNGGSIWLTDTVEEYDRGVEIIQFGDGSTWAGADMLAAATMT